MLNDEISEKQLNVLNKSGNKHAATLTLIGYKGGDLDTQINQDRGFCISPYYISSSSKEDETTDRKLLGVFDGHAMKGENVSQHCIDELPKLFASKLLSEKEKQGNPQDVPNDDEIVTKQILKEVFVELDKTAPAHISGGCTATIIYQEGSKIYIANAGDSSSFIVMYHTKSKNTKIVYLSREDKPNLPGRVQNRLSLSFSAPLPPFPSLLSILWLLQSSIVLYLTFFPKE